MAERPARESARASPQCTSIDSRRGAEAQRVRIGHWELERNEAAAAWRWSVLTDAKRHLHCSNTQQRCPAHVRTDISAALRESTFSLSVGALGAAFELARFGGLFRVPVREHAESLFPDAGL